MKSTWHRAFDKTITNETVGNIPEDIDRYFIRHTQYKPRDLQYFCAKAKEIAQTHEDYACLPINSKVIRKSVRQMTRELVDNFFLEYQYELPFIKKLINHFSGHDNIFDYSNDYSAPSLFQTVSKFVNNEKIDIEPIKLIRTLYNIGFIGGITSAPDDIMNDLPHRKISGIDYWFRFACYDQDFDISCAPKIAIHPMFNEFLHLSINKYIIVG